MNHKRVFTKTLSVVTSTNQDFEWYPTTDEILNVVESDLRDVFHLSDNDKLTMSMLDCGAGDGRVLQKLTQGDRYAIEKSLPLIEQMPSDIFIVGTDFNANTLLDKKVSVVFSNPPYSTFEDWAVKIINEANSKFIYLVIPTRWKNSKSIQSAIESRNAQTRVLGTFDFLNGDRAARAVVDVICVSLTSYSRYSGHHLNVDPFDLWFDQNFHIKTHTSEQADYEIKQSLNSKVNRTIASSGELIQSKGLIYALQDLYTRDLDTLIQHYRAFCDIDPILLCELGVNVSSVKEGLKLKISSLKDAYWRELINNLETITNKLASSSRKIVIDKLLENVHVDFNSDNAHAIVMWVIKNANHYFDSQLIELVTRMTEKANVILYKSNQRTFRDEQWRYNSKPSDLKNYKLDYRVVLERVGGLTYNFSNEASLSKSAANLLNDICTIAYNIGFDTYGFTPASQFDWESRSAKIFTFRSPSTGLQETLFEARAFKNGNLHIKFNPDFICRLNVEFGRLKGWLKTPKEAAEELDIPFNQASAAFDCNFKLESTSVPLLLGWAA